MGQKKTQITRKQNESLPKILPLLSFSSGGC